MLSYLLTIYDFSEPLMQELDIFSKFYLPSLFKLPNELWEVIPEFNSYIFWKQYEYLFE